MIKIKLLKSKTVLLNIEMKFLNIEIELLKNKIKKLKIGESRILALSNFCFFNSLNKLTT